MRRSTPPLLGMMHIVTALIVVGIGASICLTVFSDFASHPVVTIIERLYYTVTGIISIAVIWNLVQNQTEMVRHQIELGNMLRKAKITRDPLLDEAKNR